MGYVPFSILRALCSLATPFLGPSPFPVLSVMKLGSERPSWHLMESKLHQLGPDACFPSERVRRTQPGCPGCWWCSQIRWE